MKKTILLALAVTAAFAAPIRTNPAFDEILIFEGSGGVTTHSYAPGASALTTVLPLNLDSGNHDFLGLANEFYDVFYSDSTGAFDINGEYITIQAMFNSSSSSGLNVMDVQLRLGGNFVQRASVVSAFVPGATNFIPSTLANVIDNDTNTGSAMGINAPNTRMSLTVGFDVGSSPVPEPSTLAMGAAGFAVLASARLRRARRA